eukprot:TRINITY_DN14424_c0_g1_i2.p1 TRINITY_DN14424_c0_g1~~TRINITY_DN14424_c0_g1_i2.p1  ORF type:complete len:421 (-),score=71.10 TRINITY_DN14424_c0_g1_i2:77-1339(-)
MMERCVFDPVRGIEATDGHITSYGLYRALDLRVNNRAEAKATVFPQIKRAFILTLGEAIQRNDRKKYLEALRAYSVLSWKDSRTEYDKVGCWTAVEMDPQKMNTLQLAEEGHQDLLLLKLGLFAKSRNDRRVDRQRVDVMENTHNCLYRAARAGNCSVVELLLRAGSNPDIPQSNGSTPLHAATFFQHPKVVEKLLAEGANPFIRNSFVNPLKNSSQGNTPRDETNVPEILQLFDRYEQDLWLLASCGDVARFKAVYNSRKAQELEHSSLDVLESLTVDSVNEEGLTFLYCAAKRGRLQMVKALLEDKWKGSTTPARLDIPTKKNSTALHAASYFGHPEVITYLLEQGAPMNMTNGSDQTPEEEAKTDEIRQIFSKHYRNLFELASRGDKDAELKYFSFPLGTCEFSIGIFEKDDDSVLF